jgi:hypothetical protein
MRMRRVDYLRQQGDFRFRSESQNLPPAFPRERGPDRSRNGPCPCNSGKKYKHCCYAADRNAEIERREKTRKALTEETKTKIDVRPVKPEFIDESITDGQGVVDNADQVAARSPEERVQALLASA